MNKIQTVELITAVIVTIAVCIVIVSTSEESEASQEQVQIDGLLFTLEGSGAIFNGPSNNKDTVSIPETISVGGNTYKVTKIDIQDSNIIMKKMIIPKSVGWIATPVYWSNNSMEYIEVSDSNSTYSSENGVLYNKAKSSVLCYPSQKKESAFLVPDSVKSINLYAFRFCEYLEYVDLNEIEELNEGSFWNCYKIKTIIIPASLKSISGQPFVGCKALSGFIVDQGNKSFTTRDGILFSSDMRTMYRMPEGRTTSMYDIPNSVTTIYRGAFWLCKNITAVTIQQGVSDIQDVAFLGTNIVDITIPTTVTHIGSRAISMGALESVKILGSNVTLENEVFYGDENLTDIWIYGSIKPTTDSFTMGIHTTIKVHSYVNPNLHHYSSDCTFTFEKISGTVPSDPESEWPDNSSDELTNSEDGNTTDIGVMAISIMIFIVDILLIIHMRK